LTKKKEKHVHYTPPTQQIHELKSPISRIW